MRSSLCNIVHLIRQQADAELADEFVSRLPGAQVLLRESQAANIARQNLGHRSSTTKGAAGPHQVSQVIACLSHGGLDFDRVRPFLALFIEFAKEHAGARLVGRLMDELAGLDVLVRSGGQRSEPDRRQPSRLPSGKSEAQFDNRLEAAGIWTVGQLLQACTTPEGCGLVAEATGIGEAQLLHLLELVGSNRGCEFADKVVRILEAADIRVLKDIHET